MERRVFVHRWDRVTLQTGRFSLLYEHNGIPASICKHFCEVRQLGSKVHTENKHSRIVWQTLKKLNKVEKPAMLDTKGYHELL